tara:strand:+ start:238 stop:378 length:141 start_codon:yes stop_codon:yes gene_type:complete
MGNKIKKIKLNSIKRKSNKNEIKYEINDPDHVLLGLTFGIIFGPFK